MTAGLQVLLDALLAGGMQRYVAQFGALAAGVMGGTYPSEPVTA